MVFLDCWRLAVDGRVSVADEFRARRRAKRRSPGRNGVTTRAFTHVRNTDYGVAGCLPGGDLARSPTHAWDHDGVDGDSHFLSPVPASPVKHPCPCCGYQTLREPPPGTFQTCPVCRWEDDNIQFEDPTYEGGANGVSLRQARKNFWRYRVSDRRSHGGGVRACS